VVGCRRESHAEARQFLGVFQRSLCAMSNIRAFFLRHSEEAEERRSAMRRDAGRYACLSFPSPFVLQTLP